MKANDPTDVLTVGQMASAFGVAAHTLRHWESQGLVRPARTSTGERRFGPAECRRVAAILRAKSAGLSLDDIRALLLGDARSRRVILSGRRDELDRRMRAAQRSLELIDAVLDCRHGDVATCPRFAEVVSDDVDRALGLV